MPDKTKIFKTVPGAICTLILLLTLAVYAGYKINTLVQKSQYRILSEEYEFHYTATDKFTTESGFAIAAAIASFD